jgi:divalent metal cation (Fe/Co/Zn/Cd) transporter
MADDASDEESTGTVLLAGSANLAIAIAKLVGGLISGSTAMLAEAAHSFADTLNQVFLMAALKRSKKPADALHPFGYGM